MPDATLSTYCLVAACKAEVGSCVRVTDVKPANVVEVPPKEMEVEPIVKELLVNAELAMPLKVPPKVRLPELVTVPVKVKPLTVPAPETDVTVPTLIDPPRLVEVPLMVIALFVSELLPMLVNVFVEPLMDLFVNVCVPAKVATVESMVMVTGAEPL